MYVFNAGEDVARVQKEAYALYMSENGLGPLAFPSLKQMEDEVLDIRQVHCRGEPDMFRKLGRDREGLEVDQQRYDTGAGSGQRRERQRNSPQRSARVGAVRQ